MSEQDHRISDPIPTAFALLAFTLTLYGIRYSTIDSDTVVAGSTSVALEYAALVVAIGVPLCGVLGLIRGMAYPGYITTIVGLWFIGFFMIVTKGAHTEAFTPNAISAYAGVLVIPLIILAIPAIAHRNVPFIVAFAALTVMVALLAVGNHVLFNSLADAAKSKTAPDFSSAVHLAQVSSWFAFVAAGALWYVFARQILAATGVTKSDDARH